MARGSIQLIVGLAATLILAAWVGCGKKVVVPKPPPSQSPETELTYAPLQGDTSTFRVHFYWNGYDNDGEVVRFRYALDADTANSPSAWIATTAKDTTLLFLVDPIQDVLGHHFWVVAEDNDGNFDPTPAKRYFSARTLPPSSHITRGVLNSGGFVGPNFTYEWEGIDPDGSETGGPAPVDSFEYLLLPIGGRAQGDSVSLPSWPGGTLPGWPGPGPSPNLTYAQLINLSNGPSLPESLGLGGWKWTGIRGKRKRFTNITPGNYVFAIRAVDIAGATEKNVADFGARPEDRNVTYFNVTIKNAGPSLQICSSVLVDCLPATTGSEDIQRKEIQIFEGETISFSWTADATGYGGEIVGYTYALDDTTTADWGSINIVKDSVTLLPSVLDPRLHFLFVRVVDDGGLVTNAKVPLRVVHPTFKDASATPQVIVVDDFAAPGGNPLAGAPNYPSDLADDTWWFEKIVVPLGQDFPGITFNSAFGDPTFKGGWDTIRKSDGLELRSVPKPEVLKDYRVVIWYTDLNNTTSSATGLAKTLVGGAYSELAGYLRAGGTVIVTGFQAGSQTTSPPSTLTANFSRGLCAGVLPGNQAFRLSYFPREFLGLDAALPSDDALRTNGARDFVEARPTPEGSALGFVTAEVDTGGPTAKWYTRAFPGGIDNSLSPGLPKIEGWRLAPNFGCLPASQYSMIRRESPAPLAVPIYKYHGVPQGILMNGPASKREGLVVGIAVQAHDLGNAGGGVVTPGNSAGVTGRIVFLGFPVYYIKDPQAYALMRAAFAYVNASPTLPSYGP